VDLPPGPGAGPIRGVTDPLGQGHDLHGRLQAVSDPMAQLARSALGKVKVADLMADPAGGKKQ
jgi:hypothetical protein